VGKGECLSGREQKKYFLNPDTAFVKKLVKSLLENQERYGHWACPCRLASGNREEDRDILCPCDYMKLDVQEFAACCCALYVSEKVAQGETEALSRQLEPRQTHTEGNQGDERQDTHLG
jgi:ferredoxin-thioredoxin reductase catalytic subunit